MDPISQINIWINKKQDSYFWRNVPEILCIKKVDLFTLDLLRWSLPPLPRMRRKVEFSFGDEDAVYEITNNPAYDLKQNEEYYINLLKEGNRLIVGRYNNEVVFNAWAVAKRKRTYDRYFILEQGEFMSIRAEVKRGLRGQGLYMYGLEFMFSQMKGKGYSRVFMDIFSDNISSIKSTLKLGAHHLGTYFYVLHLVSMDLVIPVGPYGYRLKRVS